MFVDRRDHQVVANAGVRPAANRRAVRLERLDRDRGRVAHRRSVADTIFDRRLRVPDDPAARAFADGIRRADAVEEDQAGVDLVLTEPQQFRVDLVVVLAQGGSGARHRTGRRSEARHDAGLEQLAVLGTLDGEHLVARGIVGIGDDIARGVDLRRGYAVLVEAALTLVQAALGDPIAQDRVNGLVVGAQLRSGVEELVLDEIGLSDRVGEPLEDALRGRIEDEEFAVRGFELLRRHDAGVVVARTFAVLSAQPVVGGMSPAHAPDRFVERHIDVLSQSGLVTCLERCKRTKGGEETGAVVGDHIAGAHGWAVRGACRVGDTTEAECDAVKPGALAIRAGLPVAADAYGDQPGVGLTQTVRGELKLLQGAGPVILDQDVDGGAEAPKECFAVPHGEIERDATLAAVVLVE